MRFRTTNERVRNDSRSTHWTASSIARSLPRRTTASLIPRILPLFGLLTIAARSTFRAMAGHTASVLAIPVGSLP